MRKVFLSLLLLIPAVAFAQKNTISILGKILDGNDHLPMSYANIQLFSLPDSTYVIGTITGDDGSFSISSDITPGNYFLRMSFVGYETIDKKFDIKSENINVGRVTMNMDAVLLGEAVVVAEAIPVIVNEDTTVFSASAFRVAEGAALEELVKKLPGAEIKEDGKLYVNGKEIKKIMVDGKEFFTDDPQVALKNLPANMVEKVKTYDRQSDNARLTGMDDDEEETVLDLSVKKGMKQGWFGNVLAGAGSKLNGTQDDMRYEAGGMINRFQENTNLSVIASANNTNNQGFSEFGDSGFGVKGNAGAGITSSSILGATFAQNYDNVELGGNVQYGHSDNDAKVKRNSETRLQAGSSYRADTSSSRRKSDNIGVNFRLEWKPDSMTTIIFRPNLTYAHTKSLSDGSSRTTNNLRKPVNHNTSNTLADGDNLAFGGNLQYTRKLNKKGRNFSLSARMDYRNNESDNYSDSKELFYNELEEIDSLASTSRYTDKSNNGLTYRLQGSYTEPLSTNYRLQLRYTFQQRNSASSAFVYDDEEREIYIDTLSNKVKNQYNTHQIETNLQGQHAKFNYNVGFLVEPQSSQSETTVGLNTGKGKDTTVVNFSPNLRLRYRFSKQEMIMLRYRGQSSAPNVEYLQEVIDISDPLNRQFGNSGLKPSFRHTVTLRYSNFVSESQRSYSVNADFSNTMNAVTRQVNYDTETGGKDSRMNNVNGNWNAGAFFTFSSPLPYRKITVSSTTNAGYADDVSLISENWGDVVRSTTHTFNLRERLSGVFRIDLLDITLNASVNYTLAQNSIRKNSNRETTDYAFGGNTNINLPWNMFFSTDVNWRIFTGYTNGFNRNNVMWNAQVSKNFLKNNAATVRLKVYDILQQQGSSPTRTISGETINDTEYNTLGSYFMVHFVYRINTLGKESGKEQTENRPQRQNFGGRGGV